MDKLTVTGLGKRVDGDYDCDLSAMLIQTESPDALTNEEANTIKRLCGARGLEIVREFLDGDWVVRMAVGLVVLSRHGVDVSEAQAWKAKVGAFTFEMEPVAEEDDTADPPGEGTTPSTSGGESGNTTSDSPQENDPAPTGRLASVGS